MKKNKGGRPKKTLLDLPKYWKRRVISIKKQGGSDVEVRAELGISQDLWERFIREIDEFSLTIKRGEDLCKAWWEKHGRIQLENRNFNAVLWYMNMKNRFGWRDKNETDITSGGKPLIIQISNEIANKHGINSKSGDNS